MGFQYQLSLNAGHKYCRMLQGEHSAILSTYIELPHGFKTFVFSIFEWPLKTGFIVLPFSFEGCNLFRLKIVKGRNCRIHKTSHL